VPKQKVYEPDVPPVRLEWAYSPEEAAPYLRMSERAVTRRLDAGHIGHVMLGGKRFITGAQILAYMGEHTTDPRPEHLRPSLRNA
jgi:excisionase family DNA binding protein